MKRDPLPAKVLATRLIPNVSADMAKQLNLRPEHMTAMMLPIPHLMRLPRRLIAKLFTRRAFTAVQQMQTQSLPVRSSVSWQLRTRLKQRLVLRQLLI